MIKLTCNIDPKGARIRRIGGATLLALAGLLGYLAWYEQILWLWYAAAGIACGGGLMLFEGINGWCVLRAMGFKTKL